MDKKRTTKIENIIAFIVLGVACMSLFIMFLVDVGTGTIGFADSAPYSLNHFSLSRMGGTAFSTMTFLIPAAVLTFLFVRSQRQRVRTLSIVGSILTPFIWASVLIFRPWEIFIFVLLAPFVPIGMMDAFFAVTTGASHTGEWWSEHVTMPLFFGAIGIWMLAWIAIGALECVALLRTKYKSQCCAPGA